MRKRSLKILTAVAFGMITAAQAYAAPPYDKYTQTLRGTVVPSRAQNIANHFLVYPFELVKWPTDRGLVTIEKHHLDKKLQWLYDTIQEHGVTPYFRFLGIGMDVDFIRLTRKKEKLPDVTLKSWVQWSRNSVFEVGSRIGWERIRGTGFRTAGLFRYADRSNEAFFGIGPNTSAGDGTTFEMRKTDLEASVGYSKNPSFGADFNFGYKDVIIRRGRHQRIEENFSPLVVPGIGGDEIVSEGAELFHDTRNRKENSTTGGHERFDVSFNAGVNGSNARYFKYIFEATRFIRLLSDRRVIAIRIYAEHNNEISSRYVPFHQMARLGGYGDYPRISQTLRGYDDNRFLDKNAFLANLEYRYRIWEYRDFKLDTIFFWDEGQVFRKWTKWQLGNARDSYGMGFRFSVVDRVVFATELAHSDEGTHFYVKSVTPF